jgi:hypothetical protein
MNRTPKILCEIESIRSSIRAAALEWDATDIPGIETSVTALEGTLQPLRIFLGDTEFDTGLHAVELRRAAQALKNEAAALECLVDAAAAFLRSNPAGLSGNSDAYTFAGELRPAAYAPTESYAG